MQGLATRMEVHYYCKYLNNIFWSCAWNLTDIDANIQAEQSNTHISINLQMTYNIAVNV